MTARITITTGARLHFGLLANSPDLHRRFGGAGVMVDGAGYVLQVTAADRDEVTGSDHIAGRRAGEFLQAYRESCADNRQPPRCRIDVSQSMPPHVGLGSGTQLGMAVARALSELAGDEQASAGCLAGRVGRGLRSALGIHGFESGGFLVDGGKQADESVAPLVARLDFPGEWRFLLVRPSEARGLSGVSESSAFAKLDPMPVCTTERLCRLLLLDIVPAVAERDFDGASRSLYEFGTTVGEYFAPVQHGVFADARMSRLAAEIRTLGFQGVGQTSWGPTIFALCQSQAEAETLRSDLRSREDWSSCETLIATPRNCGALCTPH